MLSPLKLMDSGDGSQKATAYEYKSVSLGPVRELGFGLGLVSQP